MKKKTNDLIRKKERAIRSNESEIIRSKYKENS